MQYDNFLFRGGPESRLAPAMRRVLMSWDRLLPCSDYCAEESMRAWRLPAELVTVVPNGVNTEQFSPAAGDDGAGGPDRGPEDGEARTLLYVGRVGRQKGTDVLLDALELIRREHPATELVIAGPIGQFDRADFADDESEDVWRGRFDAAGVRYLGPVEDSDLAPLMASADVFVMPTRQLEMFGMAAVEAAACGTPVVSSDHGGLRETVPVEAGGRFRNEDPVDLAATVARLLDSGSDLAAVGRVARERAERYAWPAVADQLDEIYAEVARGR
jgi:glycosyltransferase involved in cell wall biosynthesis